MVERRCGAWEFDDVSSCYSVREVRERRWKRENRREAWKATPHGGALVGRRWLGWVSPTDGSCSGNGKFGCGKFCRDALSVTQGKFGCIIGPGGLGVRKIGHVLGLIDRNRRVASKNENNLLGLLSFCYKI